MRRECCWYCGDKSHMTLQGQAHVARDHETAHIMGAFSCDSCEHLSIGMTAVQASALHSQQNPAFFLALAEDPVWLPATAVGKQFLDVPAEIAAAADEVHRCLSVNAPRAAVGLARAVVEATAKEKGITHGTLFEKIEKLEEAKHIRPVIRDAAHEVRIDGNGVAHGDLADQPISSDEAEEIVALMDELLLEVYQTPARMERVRAARNRRS